MDSVIRMRTIGIGQGHAREAQGDQLSPENNLMASTCSMKFGTLTGKISDYATVVLDLSWDYRMVLTTCLDSRPAPQLGEMVLTDFFHKRGINVKAIAGAIAMDKTNFAKALSAQDIFSGFDECWFFSVDNLEQAIFPYPVTTDAVEFVENLPPLLEAWMISTRCHTLLADGCGLNYATLDEGIAHRLVATAGEIKEERNRF